MAQCFVHMAGAGNQARRESSCIHSALLCLRAHMASALSSCRDTKQTDHCALRLFQPSALFRHATSVALELGSRTRRGARVCRWFPVSCHWRQSYFVYFPLLSLSLFISVPRFPFLFCLLPTAVSPSLSLSFSFSFSLSIFVLPCRLTMSESYGMQVIALYSQTKAPFTHTY